ncbi:MAG: Na/Pi symporter [Sulfurimonas sp.]|nr:Na/Pi symporter [Sulfurimonas sp.]
MLKKYYYYFFLLTLAVIVFYSSDFKVIIAGIAIFLVGMLSMKEGFKYLSGTVLEVYLQKSTDTLPKAILSGFLATTLVQGSTLISIIVISFLNAKLITLLSAVGVIFGSNIGSTTTSWIVSSIGLKLDIAPYAMPMIIFGVVFGFSENKNIQAIGKTILGFGLIFLGIDYMKDGFESMQNSFDLTKFAMSGWVGVFVYVFIGMIVTVIMRSSGAAMALFITAVATNQISFLNGIELAIGANIGTTTTAIIASLGANANGKRVALAHFSFNMFYAIIAIIFIYPFSDFVNFLALKIGIDESNYAMKLALFDTALNIASVVLVYPFTNFFVRYLQTLFVNEKDEIEKPLYLDNIVINIPNAATEAIRKEVAHLYDNAIEVIAHSMFLHRHKFLKNADLQSAVKDIDITLDTDINEFYTNKIKSLYGDIIHYATLSQEHMNENDQNRVYDLKLASRDIVEAIKNMRDLQKNIFYYVKSKNSYIQEEYNNLRIYIAKTIDTIEKVKEHDDELDVLSTIELLKESTKALDDIKNSRIDALIRENKIDSKMATSLINDSAFAYDVTQKLLQVATILWIKDINIRTLGVQI